MNRITLPIPRLSIITPLALLATWLAGSSVTHAADVYVGSKVAAAQRVSYDAIDHTAWDELLRKFVNEQGRVDYRGWKGSAEAVSKLDAYLNHLSSIDPTKPAARESELAYWINAYNAVTVKGILRVYPTKSIRDHTPKLWGYNIWKDLKLRYADSQINLNDIEHEVLRKRREPRIHFAIVCASIGCPRLLNRAYVPRQLDEQLTAGAKHFFAQQQNFQMDAANNRVMLSSILNWFGEDFGSNDRAMLKAISPYLPSDQARELVAKSGVRVDYLEYDWGINEQK